ncbi:hypothetical protein GCM10008959_03460 [Deinococcus seoulensis]|uniref:Uncharacterized protein n=1 Tax=Deinococcus seoulensis TaxID=1837379 RepID=A0ABQ2RLY8_9DEIO|nr:hypothetical protein GCM10008959_03460 [Deinococcus seoulensis]
MPISNPRYTVNASAETISSGNSSASASANADFPAAVGAVRTGTKDTTGMLPDPPHAPDRSSRTDHPRGRMLP